MVPKDMVQLSVRLSHFTINQWRRASADFGALGFTALNSPKGFSHSSTRDLTIIVAGGQGFHLRSLSALLSDPMLVLGAQLTLAILLWWLFRLVRRYRKLLQDYQ